MSQLDDLIIVMQNNGGLFNEVIFEILEDGTLRIETGKFDAVKHAMADKLIKEAQELMGGGMKKTVKMARRHHTQIHQQHHVHNH